MVYECETWSVTLREEHRLKSVRKYGAEEVTGECRKLHNEEINGLYSTADIIRVIKSRRMSWADHVPRMRERRAVYSVWRGNMKEETTWKTQT